MYTSLDHTCSILSPTLTLTRPKNKTTSNPNTWKSWCFCAVCELPTGWAVQETKQGRKGTTERNCMRYKRYFAFFKSLSQSFCPLRPLSWFAGSFNSACLPIYFPTSAPASSKPCPFCTPLVLAPSFILFKLFQTSLHASQLFPSHTLHQQVFCSL